MRLIGFFLGLLLGYVAGFVAHIFKSAHDRGENVVWW
jgi:hypothetical protein